MDLADSKLDLQTKFEGTELTFEWVLETLYKSDNDFKKILGNSKVTDMTVRDARGGNGYCSRIFQTTISIGNRAFVFIMKVPTEEFICNLVESVRERTMERERVLNEILYLHNVECDAYKMMKNLHGFPRPDIYYLQKAENGQVGVIMMQDLSKIGTPIGIFRSVTVEHCLNFARHLADFQAYVEQLDISEWKGRYVKSIYTREDSVELEKKGMIPALEYNEGELRDQIKFFLDIDFYAFSCYCILNQAKKYDWQTLFEGNALHDLTRLIVNCADAEIRREIETAVVDAYYDCLSDKLQAVGRKVRFTREQAQELYELATLQQVSVLIKTFTYLARPLESIGKPENKAKAAKVWLRLKLACEDAQKLIEKYDMKSKFIV